MNGSIQRYHGLEFLRSLIDLMMTRDFRQRPTAQAAVQHWYSIRSDLDISVARWRLRKRDETVRERVLLDTVAAARHGIYSVKRLLNGDVSSHSEIKVRTNRVPSIQEKKAWS